MPPLTETLGTLFAQFPDLLSRIGLAIVILVLAVVISAWLGRAVALASRRRRLAPSLQGVLQRLTRWTVVVLGVVLALEQVVPNVTSLLAGLGIAGFTIGFALQDVAKNLIAGVLLLIQRPFEIGDTIEVAGFTGTALDIQLRTTDLRAVDGRYVTIPNGDVLTSPIINYSRAAQRRLEIAVNVRYDTDLEAAANAANQAIQGVPGLLAEPGPTVTFRALGDSAIQLVVQFWADMGQVDYLQAQDAAIRQLKRAFDEQGIDVSLPPVSLMSGPAGKSPASAEGRR
jgi:small-conductance mechanosensitive channel